MVFKDKILQDLCMEDMAWINCPRNLSLICLVLLVITMFSRSNVLYAIALAGIIYTYFRVFSRNISKRSERENEKYLSFHYKVVGKINRIKYRIKDNKTHKIFKCPSCSQKIRVPRERHEDKY